MNHYLLKANDVREYFLVVFVRVCAIPVGRV